MAKNNGNYRRFYMEEDGKNLETRVQSLEKKVAGLESAIEVLKEALKESSKNNNGGQLDLTTLLVLSKL